MSPTSKHPGAARAPLRRARRGSTRRARVLIVCPAPRGSTLGNRITALRWQALLRALGCRVRIARSWRAHDSCDVLVALHATKSAASIHAFHAQHPERALVVALTGTDLYVDAARDARTRASLAAATRVVVLQQRALRALSAATRRKARIVLQSALPAPRTRARATERTAHGGVLRVVSLGHLRAIKDPLLAARAARLLGTDSRVRIDHYGAALDDALARRARLESRANPRWRWRGERSHAAALRALARARVLVLTSRSEGGSSAIAEAIVAGLAILATRNDGAIGMLGRAHPGCFDVGDARALARLLARCDSEPRFLERLRRRSRELAPRFAPRCELAAWKKLLAELGVRRGRIA